MRSGDWKKIMAGLTLTAPVAFVAQAEVYLTVEQAAAALFPGTKMDSRVIELSADDVKAIEKASGEKVPTPHVRAWTGPDKQMMIVDVVLGKHEYITYAVGISADGEVRGVEIMDYKETFGYQVREQSWRNQFVGKTSKDKVRLDRDIQNISGATLSSSHVTNGVRRVLQTYEIVKAKV